MPPEPLSGDREEHGSSLAGSCRPELTRWGSAQLRKRPAFDEDYISRRVLISQKDMKIDESSKVLDGKLYSGSLNDSAKIPCHKSPNVSEGRLLKGKTDKLADNIIPSNWQDSGDYSLGLDCRPIRWTRSASLSSHESELSRSSNSKSMLADSSSLMVKLPKFNADLCQSPSEERDASVTPTTPSDKTSPWKRPRLRWGEGLAKFEEKKSFGLDDDPNKREVGSPVSSQISHCASPATPSSIACSSFPGSGDKELKKMVAADSGIDQSLEIPFSLEKLDLSIFTHIVSSLIEMINSNSKCLADSSFSSYTGMSKLLLLKSDIVKELSITEAEVDLLEKQIKSFSCDSGSNSSDLPTSDLMAVKFSKKSTQDQEEPSKFSCESALSQKSITGKKLGKEFADGVYLERSEADMDSPRTMTSKLFSPFGESDAASATINDGEHLSLGLDASGSLLRETVTFGIAAQAGRTEKACCLNNVAQEKIDAFNSSDLGCQMAVDNQLVDSVWASNKEYAYTASEFCNSVFPVAEVLKGDHVVGCSSSLSLKEIIVRKKKLLRFKEQAMTLKWKAFLNIWKEDLRLTSVKSNHPKVQKRSEINLGTAQSHRRNSHPSDHVRCAQVNNSYIDIGKHPSVSHLEPYRSILKMPPLILDDSERRMSQFVTRNGFVEDPCAVEKERSWINAWKTEEKDIFIHKLASHGKNFRKIAVFLDHKTTADCVEFYYKNQKSENFKRIIKKQEKRDTYLVTSTKRWDRGIDTAYLDMLGAASEIVARNIECDGNKRRKSRFLLRGFSHNKSLQTDGPFTNNLSDFKISRHEIETADSGIFPGACGSVSSETMSSCITSSVNQGNGYPDGTLKNLSKQFSIPEDVPIDDDDEACSDESSYELDVVYWNDMEKSLFVHAVKSHGKDFSMISRCVRTKSKDQCKSFYSKARKCLGLDVIHLEDSHEKQFVTNDKDDDGGTSEPASTVETLSGTGSYKLSQMVEEDPSLCASVTSQVHSSPEAGIIFYADQDKLKDCQGKGKMSIADIKVDSHRSEDRSVSYPDEIFSWSNSSATNCINKQDSSKEISKSASNKTIDIPSSLPVFEARVRTSGIVVKEKGRMDFPLIHDHNEKYGAACEYVPTNASSFIRVSGTAKAPRIVPVDSQYSYVGISTKIPCKLLASNNFETKGETYQPHMFHHSFSGLSNSNSFGKIGYEERQEFCLGTANVGNHLHPEHALLNQFYVSQVLEKRGDQNGTSWTLNFTDSTVSRDSKSNSESSLSSLPSYPSFSQGSYIQKCNSSKSDFSVLQVPYFRHGDLHSTNQLKSSLGSEMQDKKGNIKLFGQVLSPPSAVPQPYLDTQLMQGSNFPHFPQLIGRPLEIRPSNHQTGTSFGHPLANHNIFLGDDNIPVRRFWDGHQMQIIPIQASGPLLLPLNVPSLTYLDYQPLQPNVLPNVSTPPNSGSYFGDSLHRSIMPHISNPAFTRHGP